jgi:hypothetical protein
MAADIRGIAKHLVPQPIADWQLCPKRVAMIHANVVNCMSPGAANGREWEASGTLRIPPIEHTARVSNSP